MTIPPEATTQALDARHQEEKQALGNHEICAICKKGLWSINTVNMGDYFMCYTCGMPIKHLLTAITNHIVNSIVTLVNVNGVGLEEATHRMGIRHLDVRRLSELEAILGFTGQRAMTEPKKCSAVLARGEGIPPLTCEREEGHEGTHRNWTWHRSAEHQW